MTRRRFLGGALAAGATAGWTQSTGMARLRVRKDRKLSAIAPDFMGLGYEISSVARPGLLSRQNRDYVQLVRTLGARGVIRIGGNTSDYARYAPQAAAVSSPKGTVVNNAVLRDLGGFLEATGWRLIWGFNLGTGTEAEAIAEAKAVKEFAGEKLLAFEIGNEPDLFGRARHRQMDYGYDDWLTEYRRWKTALRKDLPGVPTAGPDVAGKTDWVTRFADDEGKDAVLLTHHYYREGQNQASTMGKLLGADPKLEPQLSQLRAASGKCGLPYRICEVNSFSGGGRPGVSDTMAAALWVLDYMFTLAASGCAGVNMETGVNQLDFVSSYSPIGDDEHRNYMARPEYYGMLAFARAGNGQLLGVEMDGSAPELKAYATETGRNVLAVTVINKGGRGWSIDIDGAGRGREASVLRLSGPAVDAKSGVTLGGAEVTPAGVWKPARFEKARVRGGRVEIEVPAASAAVVEVAQE
jgi:Glycosyl hydrolase family 79 C-terminal beta domain